MLTIDQKDACILTIDQPQVLSEQDIATARTNSQLAALKMGGVGFGFFIPTAIQVTLILF